MNNNSFKLKSQSYKLNKFKNVLATFSQKNHSNHRFNSIKMEINEKKKKHKKYNRNKISQRQIANIYVYIKS